MFYELCRPSNFGETHYYFIILGFVALPILEKLIIIIFIIIYSRKTRGFNFHNIILYFVYIIFIFTRIRYF